MCMREVGEIDRGQTGAALFFHQHPYHCVLLFTLCLPQTFGLYIKPHCLSVAQR